MAGPEPANGRVPVPDPTRLTQEAVDRAVATLKDIFAPRFHAIENDAERLRAQIDARPAAVAVEISHLNDLFGTGQKLVDEKFKGVADQFAGRDTALAAALLAQKTSVEEQNKSNAAATAKSEASFTKQIDGIAILIGTLGTGFTDKVDTVKEILTVATKTSDTAIADMKTRLTAIESRKEGSASVGVLIFSLIGAGAGVAAIIGLILVIARGA